MRLSKLQLYDKLWRAIIMCTFDVHDVLIHFTHVNSQSVHEILVPEDPYLFISHGHNHCLYPPGLIV